VNLERSDADDPAAAPPSLNNFGKPLRTVSDIATGRPNNAFEAAARDDKERQF